MTVDRRNHLAVGLGTLFALLALVCAAVPDAAAQEPSGLAAAAAIEQAMIEAIAQAEKSVVAIARVHHETAQIEVRADVFGQPRIGRSAAPGEFDFIPNDYATGVVVDAGGLILTTNHVLRENSSFYVTTSDRRVYPAQVVAADPRGDLAVLRIAERNLTPIKMGDASKLRKGQIVIALGNPYSLARDGQVSASWGIIANLGRKDGPTPPVERGSSPTKPTLHQYGTLIQTDAKLNLGTSGGALVNLNGEMVGLTVALAATMGYEQSAGFAIPVDETFKRTLARLVEGREAEYGFLGVKIEPLAQADRARGRTGVVVTDVVTGTPAQQVSLRPGDVLTHVGRQQIFDPDQFMLSIGSAPASGRVELTIMRDGRSVTREVELAKYFVPGKKVVTQTTPAWRGMRVDYVTASEHFPDWASQPGRLDPQGSLLITEVDEDSAAWREGLRPDMIISQAGGRAVRTPREFQEVVGREAGPVRLDLITTGGERLTRAIPPDAS